MTEQVYSQQWVKLGVDTRNKLREIFSIPRTSHTEVVTDHTGVGTVVSDGTTNIDLQAVTVEKMRDYLGTAAINETISDLFKRTVDKIECKIDPVVEKVVETTITPTPEEKPQESKISENLPTPDDTKSDSVEGTVVNNVNKCPDCEYTHASKQGMRMHIMKKHLHK